MATKPGSKYFPLFRFLRSVESERAAMSFEDIEALIGENLPASARQRRAFWSNRDRGGHQAAAWLQAGYHVHELDLAEERVVFRKKKLEYQVPERSGSLAWDADSLRSLRRHMGLSQAEFAAELGVRQQTVSEWETGQYEPSRSRSEHLRLVAEQADFPYEVENGS